MIVLAFLLLAGSEIDDSSQQLLQIKRVYVDRLNGGDTAMQLRDMLITAMQGSKLFVVTENQERADAILRGTGEDLIFTDTFQSSEGINAHMNASTGRTFKGSTASGRAYGTGPSAGVGVGESESTRIAERKHEASISVRLVNKEGDVIWSTTQESLGGKFRGASADVADKVTKKLMEDMEKARKEKAAQATR
jgi:hypothetical protein